MQLSNQSKSQFKYKKNAMKKWAELLPVMNSERMSVVLDSVSKFAEKYTLLPREDDVFDMFRMILPHEVKVVFVGQSPYPGYCPVTKIPYACGPAFLPSLKCITTPLTLQNIVSEVCRDFGIKKLCKPPSRMLIDWIDQGTMLLNASMTMGTNCPKYLEDHSVAWEEVMQEILLTISEKLNPVFVLVGKDAWKFENCITRNCRVIKVSHPVARKETSTPWMKSSVFSSISSMLIDKEIPPIQWIRYN